ncbi:hypothetical protein T310_3746 [Rasamsonia emersonii CBS 393.64]|uniref:HTH psq-type domain-containing protein n=1 Tax=Rasamsonia emersonii (strain ATCC 16479 / CBS 393.64 / IMI 116815) TaxID=1408163 RepID=A0A0F4YX89_RASE3|nr:hypothetical protein T310_3746 [Rasamsonia emersonii CBS 393.64]KKA22228.1 hypothetical protein T310_3746 [Rasamsonia emersonii CBS 393.64]
MPPKTADSAAHKEARIMLAIAAKKNGQISSTRAAKQAFDVPESTLRARLKVITLTFPEASNHNSQYPQAQPGYKDMPFLLHMERSYRHSEQHGREMQVSSFAPSLGDCPALGGFVALRFMVALVVEYT